MKVIYYAKIITAGRLTGDAFVEKKSGINKSGSIPVTYMRADNTNYYSYYAAANHSTYIPATVYRQLQNNSGGRFPFSNFTPTKKLPL
jgi:hypothetical protein